MTRRGPAASVTPGDADGRLANARAYRAAAEQTLTALPSGGNANPSRSLIALSAIAYADALTARFGGFVNRKDHAAAAQALRTALGNRLPAARARDLAVLLEDKDEVQYGIRIGRRAEAERALERLRDFGDWAETTLASAY